MPGEQQEQPQLAKPSLRLGLQLVDDVQTSTIEWAETTITHGKLSWDELCEIQESCRDRDTQLVNHVEVQRTIVRRKVVGWTNVIDRNGNPVPFRPELVTSLPPEVVDFILGSIYRPIEREIAEAKN